MKLFWTAFIAYVLFFAYVAYGFIQDGFSTGDLALFSLFIILSMVALIGIGNDSRASWLLSIVLFAFLLNYMIFLFLQATTVVRFILILVMVVAFIGSIVAIGKQDEPDIEDLDEERVSTEKAFNELKDEFKKAAKEKK
tara:strand:+ start:427 stop:843 length:417 start_codon:yes stop_codon:yes gene_type:complete